MAGSSVNSEREDPATRGTVAAMVPGIEAALPRCEKRRHHAVRVPAMSLAHPQPSGTPTYPTAPMAQAALQRGCGWEG